MPKSIAFILFIFFTASGYSQMSNSYSVQVTLKEGPQNGKAFLRYFTTTARHLDSANFTNGRFTFTGNLSQKVIFAKLYFLSGNDKTPNNENACEILLEPASIKIVGDKNLFTAKFHGTILQEQFSELQESLTIVRKKGFVLNDKLETADKENNAEAKDKLLAEDFPLLFLEKQKLLGAFIQKYPSSPISGYKFGEFAGDEDIDPNVVKPAYNMLSDDIKKMSIVEEVMQRVTIAEKTAIGMGAIDFTQTDTSGNNISLSSYKGKYVLIDFWAGWCIPCREENPMLIKLYTEYHDKGFDIISVSLDGDREEWTKAITKDKMIWANVSDLKIFDNAVSKQYGITSIPQSILINPDGKIIAKNLRGAALENQLSQMLK